MPRTRRPHQLLIAAVLLAFAGAVQAQALFIARKAIGRIEQLTQTAPASTSAPGATYDVATVIVDVAADRVYAAALRLLAGQTQLRVTRSDDARQSIEFADGTQTGALQVSRLGDNLSQLLVTTAHNGKREAESTTIATHILDVCRQLEVVCERAP